MKFIYLPFIAMLASSANYVLAHPASFEVASGSQSGPANIALHARHRGNGNDNRHSSSSKTKSKTKTRSRSRTSTKRPTSTSKRPSSTPNPSLTAAAAINIDQQQVPITYIDPEADLSNPMINKPLDVVPIRGILNDTANAMSPGATITNVDPAVDLANPVINKPFDVAPIGFIPGNVPTVPGFPPQMVTMTMWVTKTVAFTQFPGSLVPIPTSVAYDVDYSDDTDSGAPDQTSVAGPLSSNAASATRAPIQASVVAPTATTPVPIQVQTPLIVDPVDAFFPVLATVGVPIATTLGVPFSPMPATVGVPIATTPGVPFVPAQQSTSTVPIVAATPSPTPAAATGDAFDFVFQQSRSDSPNSPNASPEIAALITEGMQKAVVAYNKFAVSAKQSRRSVNVYYDPAVPTADASYQGSIRFGNMFGYRVSLHEMSHVIGIGTHPAWPSLIKDGLWTGTNGIAQLKAFDGPDAVLHADSMHFWPYGLNYDTEWSDGIDKKHVLMVDAMLKDMQAVSPQ